jgi:hypothetical protein
VFALVHTPPVGEQERVVVLPVHNVAVPVIAPMLPVTVTVLVTEQPAADV